MKKIKYFIYTNLLVAMFGIVMFIILIPENKQEKVVNYGGNNLLVSIDGKDVNFLPTTGVYYLASYDCDNSNTVVKWNKETYELVVSNKNKKGSVSCDLKFKSKPMLYEMPVGSYVKYVGKGGTVGDNAVTCQSNGENSCIGKNANEELNASDTYGYCGDSLYKYHTTGFRIAYVNSGNKTMIVSAGALECVDATDSVDYIKKVNTMALGYCNSDYVDGGCTCTSLDDGLCVEASSDAWALGDRDFYYMTKAISGVGKRISSGTSSLGDLGGTLGDTLYCHGGHSYKECGYNNDLIDNGGYYGFAAQDSFDATALYFWSPSHRTIYDTNSFKSYGFRPVISLSSLVYVTGGTGTMDDPYTIAK